jgi:hypothetical protein
MTGIFSIFNQPALIMFDSSASQASLAKSSVLNVNYLSIMQKGPS